ncbi:MAG: hypothetical protein COX62_06880 [Deltaproteobacteria bacterium CG_4_10_14_0_2_um_filter_43_8]|nr:MAG: hypothetical protein COV43_05355 [Deltaproteobacteria bacterium CG11_big_fil_rev_8_21_14_0_20_42_23]PJA19358.1 MAG: hypothetical protein COX62_06880 [Deltaproteobacteria bacterium CG_4_10_14_0_2_um_filter_43_8]PJC64019.1 MAG: hypothetical protein CO021_06330 [Deltaproteobacteria bacterium CG_4_9_14_0_2_um_filter_42_21]
MNVKFPGMRALRVIFNEAKPKNEPSKSNSSSNPSASAFAASGSNTFGLVASRTVGRPSSASLPPLSPKEGAAIDKDLRDLSLGIAAAKHLGLPAEEEKNAALRIAMLHTMLEKA